ncbi:MAG: pknK 2 [Solirubrobacterales bacterium]|nr:pknK 2 [Solirubrobacterales bacterium]
MRMAQAIDPSTRAGSTPPLLRTKLVVPEVAGEHVRRHRLVDALRAGAERRLTLVDAPAGFGKTTLVADWCAADSERRSFAWLTLDRSLDAPERFWTSVIAALAEAAPGIALDLPGRGCAVGASTGHGHIVDKIISVLADAPQMHEVPIVLALDDYHALSRPEIHRDVAYLLENLPRGLRLMILTRSDPPFPLGRLRANGGLAELRAEDLRFTIPETEALLNRRLGLGLDGADVAHLRERTEGWIAGLSLAAISLREHPDPKAFVRAFAGTNRHVVDYLKTEVPALQREEERVFLCRTSILNRLTGPLCDAVLERRGSIQTLRRLERANAFVVPLDCDRTSYRYHQLLAELLRGELAAEDPAVVAGLHRRASLWYRARGVTVEAVDHAVAAGDIASVPDLVAPVFVEMIQAGRVRTVAGWLRALPGHAVAGDPRLCLAAATVAVEEGRPGDVASRLARAQASPWPGPLPGGPASIQAGVATLHGASMAGDAAGRLEAARLAVSLSGDDCSWWGGMAAGVLGEALYWAGRPDEAHQWLEDAGRRGGPLTRARARAHEALLALDDGDRVAAEHVARDALAIIRDNALDRYPRTGPAHVALGRSLATRGAIAAASVELETALELARRASDRGELIHALTALAPVRHAGGVVPDARTLCLEARAELERCREPGGLTRLVEAGERHLWTAWSQDAPQHEAEPLSSRELDVLRLLPTALTEPGMGDELFISRHTVHSHTRAIYRKLGVSSREQAVQRGRTLGLLTAGYAIRLDGSG